MNSQGRPVTGRWTTRTGGVVHGSPVSRVVVGKPRHVGARWEWGAPTGPRCPGRWLADHAAPLSDLGRAGQRGVPLVVDRAALEVLDEQRPVAAFAGQVHQE